MAMQLPERPNFSQLKKRAREIAREFQLPLNKAQLNMARGYGFASWTKLKAHVAVVESFSREPDVLAGDDFLSLACLGYGQDDAARWARAAEMLLNDPSIATRDTWHAAACANASAIVPAEASLQHAPFGWEPLLYLCYSRVPMSEMDALATATALLDAGADPNAGFLWHGLPTPFTALTGVLGAGETDQLPHPHWKALARLLLERGANANDAQALYNRQFRPGTDHLELLFEFGLGRGDGGPWNQRMGDQMESPTQMVQHQLRWAIHHNMIDRVRLFVERGVDVTTPFDEHPSWAALARGRTPIEFAAVCGATDIVELLAAKGAELPELSPVDAYVAALLSGQAPEGDAAAAIASRPSLVVQAAASGRTEIVSAVVAAGFDVNALGRADAPVEQHWQTALHTAVELDDAEMVRLLLQLGADPFIEDARFHSTPLGWAQHFDHTELATLLGGSVRD
jgi:ankyrin repeat protein